MKSLNFTLPILSLGAVLVGGLHSQVKSSNAAPESTVTQEFLRKAGPGWRVRLSADNRRIESVVGFGTRSYGDQPELAARNFLTENASLFGLKPDLSDMRVLSAIQSKVSGHVEFQQIVNGLPLENAKVRVNLSKDGRVLQAVNRYAPLAPQEPVTPVLSKDQAVEAAVTEYFRRNISCHVHLPRVRHCSHSWRGSRQSLPPLPYRRRCLCPWMTLSLAVTSTPMARSGLKLFSISSGASARPLPTASFCKAISTFLIHPR